MLKILVKYPSRGRPERFFKSLDSFYTNIAVNDHFHVSVTLDDDDVLMNNPPIIKRIKEYKNISIVWGKSESKVHAINRDMPPYPFDILLVLSDDMAFNFYGFDELIRMQFKDGLDWLIHLPDQDEKDRLATMYIAGKAFFDRFGWIYNPVYKSLFCDTELMEIAKELGRYKYVDVPGVISHLLPAYGHLPSDQLWREQQQIGWTVDQKTYLSRKSERLNDRNVLNDWIDAFKHDSL